NYTINEMNTASNKRGDRLWNRSSLMCSRSDTPGAGGTCIWITLFFVVQAAIIAVENTIGFQPTPEIEGAIFFVSLYNELDIIVCIYRTGEITTAYQWWINREVPINRATTCLLLYR